MKYLQFLVVLALAALGHALKEGDCEGIQWLRNVIANISSFLSLQYVLVF